MAFESKLEDFLVEDNERQPQTQKMVLKHGNQKVVLKTQVQKKKNLQRKREKKENAYPVCHISFVPCQQTVGKLIRENGERKDLTVQAYVGKRRSAQEEILKRYPQAFQLVCRKGKTVNVDEYKDEKVVWIRNFRGKKSLTMPLLSMLISGRQLEVVHPLTKKRTHWRPELVIIQSKKEVKDWYYIDTAREKKMMATIEARIVRRTIFLN